MRALALALGASVFVMGCGKSSLEEGCCGEFEFPPLPPVDSIRIEPDSVEMAVGDTVELRAVVWSGMNVLVLPARWFVSDTDVATLGGFGGTIALEVLVEARGIGGTTVVAFAGQGTEVVSDTAIVIVR